VRKGFKRERKDVEKETVPEDETVSWEKSELVQKGGGDVRG